MGKEVNMPQLHADVAHLVAHLIDKFIAFHRREAAS